MLVFSSEDRSKVFLTSLVEMSMALSLDGFIDNCWLERAMGRLVTGFMDRVEMIYMGKLDMETCFKLEGSLNVMLVV